MMATNCEEKKKHIFRLGFDCAVLLCSAPIGSEASRMSPKSFLIKAKFFSAFLNPFSLTFYSFLVGSIDS